MPEHIMLIEYEEHIGPHCIEKVALYNSNHISMEEAFRVIRSGAYSDNVLIMSKNQWTQLFKNGKE